MRLLGWFVVSPSLDFFHLYCCMFPMMPWLRLVMLMRRTTSNVDAVVDTVRSLSAWYYPGPWFVYLSRILLGSAESAMIRSRFVRPFSLHRSAMSWFVSPGWSISSSTLFSVRQYKVLQCRRVVGESGGPTPSNPSSTHSLGGSLSTMLQLVNISPVIFPVNPLA